MPEPPATSVTLLENLSRKKPATIAAFNAAIDGWHISQDKNGVYWLDNSFVEGFKLPTLEEADLVNVAHMMLLAYAHGYITGRKSQNSH